MDLYLYSDTLHRLVNGIIPYEKGLFLFINGHHNLFFDQFMSLYSGKIIWLPLAIAAFCIHTIKIKKMEILLIIAAITFVFLLCDQLSAAFIKPLCQRLRPTHYPQIGDLVHVVNNYRGGRYGFISAHSANGFGIATFSSLLFRYKIYTFVIFLWASLTAYSRIYLGVHFISDVVGGIMLGVFIGWLVYFLYIKTRSRVFNLSLVEAKVSAFSAERAQILIYTIGTTVLFIAIRSFFIM
ncbi:MAG: phosphatase PAP2 family protein [Dysgonamonadaceae bacterium]